MAVGGSRPVLVIIDEIDGATGGSDNVSFFTADWPSAHVMSAIRVQDSFTNSYLSHLASQRKVSSQITIFGTEF